VSSPPLGDTVVVAASAVSGQHAINVCTTTATITDLSRNEQAPLREKIIFALRIPGLILHVRRRRDVV
jgi:hypothetical protein